MCTRVFDGWEGRGFSSNFGENMEALSNLHELRLEANIVDSAFRLGLGKEKRTSGDNENDASRSACMTGKDVPLRRALFKSAMTWS